MPRAGAGRHETRLLNVPAGTSSSWAQTDGSPRARRWGEDPTWCQTPERSCGDLTGDESLQREARVDETSSAIEDKVGDGADNAEDLLRDCGGARMWRDGASTPSSAPLAEVTVDRRTRHPQEDAMSLIKRKKGSDDESARCPNCRERLPEGARQCTMCGRSVADVSTEAQRERAGDPREP